MWSRFIKAYFHACSTSADIDMKLNSSGYKRHVAAIALQDKLTHLMCFRSPNVAEKSIEQVWDELREEFSALGAAAEADIIPHLKDELSQVKRLLSQENNGAAAQWLLYLPLG
eukprot:PhM_4_TR8449/c0_g1_i1/m.103250